MWRAGRLAPIGVKPRDSCDFPSLGRHHNFQKRRWSGTFRSALTDPAGLKGGCGSLKKTIVSISSSASNSPSDGHFYWMYRYLAERNRRRSTLARTVIGPESAHAPHVTGIISNEAKRRRFRIRTQFERRDNWDRVETAISDYVSAGVSRFQMYDGGLAELSLALKWARKFPSALFLYNFHWALSWLDITESSKFSATLLRFAIRFSLKRAPRNLIICAETKRLGDHLSRRLGAVMLPYPVFSTLRPAKPTPWSNRPVDVLIFPANNARKDLRIALTLGGKLQLSGLQVRVVARETDIRSEWEDLTAPRPNGLGSDSFVFTPLDKGRYTKLLANARVVVLPYTNEYFRFGSSGKFNEAIAAGAFPFCFEGTAIAGCSQLPESAHFLPTDGLDIARDQILQRVASGFDTRLVPATIADLDLLFSKKEAINGRADHSSGGGFHLLNTVGMIYGGGRSGKKEREQRVRRVVGRVSNAHRVLTRRRRLQEDL